MSNEHSQIEVNKMLRIMNGTKPLKFTVRVNYPTGKVVEFQSNFCPEVEWQNDCRKYFVTVKAEKGYDSGKTAVMEWIEGTIIMTETNPEGVAP